MMFFLILSSLLVSGVVTERDCESRPSCVSQPPISRESIKAYKESGLFFPSDQFLTETCGYFIQNVKCIQSYYEECSLNNGLIADLNAMLSNVEELCDTESDIRQGYVAHVDCMNDVNFTSRACFTTSEDIFNRLSFYELRKRNVTPPCMQMYLLEHCFLTDTEEICGDEAKQLAEDIINRLWTIYMCDQVDEQEYENAKNEASN